MMMGKHDKLYEELEALSEKHGVPDFVFCGVDLDDAQIIDSRIGTPGNTTSNRVRAQRMVGILQEEITYISYKNLYEAGSFEGIHEPGVP
jgi:hypothetical protein